ncbi:MAG: hypothetical protein GXY85_07770 [Candidatus Brocadiaceae bacterium]|nr:hypothetical protein [Candidatus Brocadiaceae bacterium]
MKSATQVIQDALDSVPVYDPHCHLRPQKPWADSLADIALYHHVWIELVSSGLGQTAVTETGLPHEISDPGLPPLERLRRALPYLPNVRNTTAGLCLRWILGDLYGLDGDLNERNLEAAFRAVEEHADSREWNEHVLRERCRIEYNITVKDGEPHGPRLLQGRERIPIHLGGSRWAPHEALARYEERFGFPIRNADDYGRLLAATARAIGKEGLRFIGISLPPTTAPEGARPEDIDAVIRKALNREPLSREELGGVSHFAIRRLLQELRATPLRTVQMLAGAQVLPPHRSLPQWDGGFTGHLGRLAAEFEDFHFNISAASDNYTHDIAVLAKHVPNISVAGHWWHTLYPHYIRRAIETRIDLVPMPKIVAYFSDAYHSEWCYPKLKLIKAIWADVLSERVERGWMDTGTATDLIRAAFWENPRRIYGGP